MPVSGSRIVIAGDVDRAIVRLVDAAGTLAESGLGDWALIGGLAVMMQLAEAHRVTADVDAAADDDDGRIESALEVLIDQGRAHRDMDQLYVGEDTKVDVIAVYALPTELPDGDLDRVFLIASRWAVTTSIVTEVSVTGSDGTILTTASFPIATPSALIAMKLQAHQQRDRPAQKRASDVYDLYRLMREHDHDRGGGIGEVLATAPEDLTAWSAETIERTFVSGAAHWSRQLNVYSRGPQMGAVSAEDLEVVGSLAVERLRRTR